MTRREKHVEQTAGLIIIICVIALIGMGWLAADILINTYAGN